MILKSVCEEALIPYSLREKAALRAVFSVVPRTDVTDTPAF
jgi:hypothetical protein